MRTINIILVIILTFSVVGFARLELYMADPEVRIAQKIYCQIENAEVTDKLQATLDGTVIFEKNGNLQSEEIFTANYRNQQAGKHELVVMILDRYGQIKESVTKSWVTLHNGIPMVGIDENNSLRLNGELFFPIYALLDDGDMIYFVENGYMNSGANEGWNAEGYTVETYRDWLNLCNQKGAMNVGPGTRWEGMVIRTGRDCDTTSMKEYVDTFKVHPAQLIWQWADEPDGGGTDYCAFPDAIRSWTEVCHRNDTDHPHAVNLVAYDWTWDLNYYINHCGDYSYLHGADWHGGQKKLIADIIGFDYYPIEFATVEYAPGPVTFAGLAKALDRLREWNYDLCPIFSWIENCDLSYGEYTKSAPYPNFTCNCEPPNCCTPGVDCPATDRGGDCKQNQVYIWTPPPTPEQMWSEYWIKVIHGVKGFKIHPHFAPDGHSQPPRNHETMAKFMSWVNDLKEGLLGPESKTVITDDANETGSRVDFIVREDDENIYIFAARLTEVKENDYPSINVTFNIENITSGQIQVYGEDRSINITSNEFQDSFTPWDVHIYKIAKKGLSVELMKFEGHVIEEGVELTWTTASEHNNYGFEVERSPKNSTDFKKIGFIHGSGTTSKRNQYRFVDKNVIKGNYFYQLKQIDNDGSYEFVGKIEISFGLPNRFQLYQNYPNPFNPVTMISYNIPKASHVKLKIYDINSKEVYQLIDEFQNIGSYSIIWNASSFPSGTYFYNLKSGNFNETKRMLLVK